MFRVKHDDPPHGWLGASPDGLVESLQAQTAGAEAPGGPPPLEPGLGSGVLAGPGPGILEIKCPYNKGRPELAVPPEHAIWYYMPQVCGIACGENTVQAGSGGVCINRAPGF